MVPPPQQLERERATEDSREADVSTSAPPAIEVSGLTKVYGSGDEAVTAVDGIDLSVEPGSVVGILGPNGAGKTTAIKSLLGLIEPTSGEVKVAGVDVREDPRQVYRAVGAMLEGARNVYWRLTVRENLRFFAALGGQDPDALADRHARLLNQLNLAEKADVPVNELSRGMKQKVSLACTLARQTQIAFLDEPTLGLDVESSIELRRELRRLARERDMTVVLSSHDLDVIEALCDRVLILSEGRVIADDDVESLIDVFRTQAYELTVEELPEGVRDRLATRYGLADVETVGDRVSFEVNVDGAAAFYDLIEELRASGVRLTRVNSIEPDLEDVFIQLTNSDTQRGETK
jgi:ABC-2 type transport system ATP-binding protein